MAKYIAPMPTSVVTGGAGFLGSHLCDYLVAKATVSSASTTSTSGTLENIDHLRGERFTFVTHNVDRADPARRRGRLRLPPRRPREPRRLPARTAEVAQGRFVRHAQCARSRQVEARPIPDLVDQRGLRRPAGAPAVRDLLGQRQSDRPARRLRRGEALRRGADDDVPHAAGRGHLHRADLQHVRAAHAPKRRAGIRQVPQPGDRGEAADRLRRRDADPLALLRRRPDPRSVSARRERRAPSGQSRQPGPRVDDARTCADRDPRLGLLRARSCSRRCRSTTRRCGVPTSPARSRCSAGQPEIDLEEGLRRWVAVIGREPAPA